VTFPCEGDEAVGTVPADLVFVVVERAHAKLRREGHNLVFATKLSLADALTDCSVQVYVQLRAQCLGREGGRQTRDEAALGVEVAYTPRTLSLTLPHRPPTSS